MNILYIVPNPPSLERVRPYNLIRHLHARGHRVTIATVWANAGERADVERLRGEGFSVIAAPLSKLQIAANLLRALVAGRPLQAEYSWQPDLKNQISNIKRQFDVIHVEHLRGAHLGVELRNEIQNQSPRIPVVWDSVDCITYLFEQAAKQSQSLSGKLITRLELGPTRKYEGWLVNQFDHVLTTSEKDKAELERLAGRTAHLSDDLHPPISVLPNGVDLNHFTPDDAARQPDTIVFSGRLSYHANVTAALYVANEVMPLVWARRPGARLILAGSGPSAEVRKLAEAHPASVEVTGYVSDLGAYLRRASVAVAPLRYGAGIQNKVLEAMACGTPVATTPLAVSALKVRNGVDCLVADSPQAFADAILNLLADDATRERLGAAGRRYVEAHHNWNDISAQLESIYQQSIEYVGRTRG